MKSGLVVATVVAMLAMGGAGVASAKKAKRAPAPAASPVVDAPPAGNVAGGPVVAATNAAAAESATPVATSESRPTAPAAKVLSPKSSAKASAPEITVSPRATVNGGTVLANVGGLVEGDIVTVSFDGARVPVTADDGFATSLVGVDINVSPGTYPVTARVRRDGKTITVTAKVKVAAAKYPIQRITVDKGHATDISEANLAWDRQDKKELAALWGTSVPERLWTGSFRKPVPGDWSEPFGGKRIVNGEPRQPHVGIDQRAKEGEPIKAINAGRVVYEKEQFFCGNMTVIDHGQGVFSEYCHQSKFLAKVGQTVKKGETIGLIGHTGRTTGPHLHWAMRIDGARIDPKPLLEMSLPDTPGRAEMVMVSDSADGATLAQVQGSAPAALVSDTSAHPAKPLSNRSE